MKRKLEDDGYINQITIIVVALIIVTGVAVVFISVKGSPVEKETYLKLKVPVERKQVTLPEGTVFEISDFTDEPASEKFETKRLAFSMDWLATFVIDQDLEVKIFNQTGVMVGSGERNTKDYELGTTQTETFTFGPFDSGDVLTVEITLKSEQDIEKEYSDYHDKIEVKVP